ncbi:hypothetical protein [Streptomyces sp. NPDC055299]
MSDAEFDDFLRYLADRYLKPQRVPHRLHREDDWFLWNLEQLRRADEIIDLIESVASSEDIPEEISDELLKRAAHAAASGLTAQNRLAKDTGVMDVLDEYFVEISRRLRPDHLPSGEAQSLREFGFDEIADNLSAIIYEARIRADRYQPRQFEEFSVSRRLRQLEERLDETEDEPPRKRKWFTGLGDIVTGAALSIADIGMVIGTIRTSTPIPPWVAIPSSTGGFAQIFKGSGVLRGE